jgi:hypothetical protein
LRLAALRLLCWVLPAWPAALFVISGARRRLAVLLALWLALGVVRMLSARRARPRSTPIYVAHLALCGVPLVLFSFWLLAGPVATVGSVTLVAASCVLLLLCDTLWIRFGHRTAGWGWLDAVVLPAMSILVALLASEIGAAMLLSGAPFGANVAANSPDRSYWYVVHKADAGGDELATTYGFLGPEPAPSYAGLRVVVIGDSIPDADRAVNFPKIAQALFADAKSRRTEIEIVNAAISSYSLEQIKRFYTERLVGLRHDILVVSLYLDDINRELRYRKQNYLYTPSWPEWMQDVYYRSFVCRTFLNAAGFEESTFLLYRTRGKADSLPAAIRALDEIRAQATRRGAVMAIFNVPIFDWPDVLPTSAAYRFRDMNAAFESWARDRGVHYRDVLPVLVGRDIRPLRRGPTNIHFSEEGHRLVGAEFQRFLDGVIDDDEALRDRARPARRMLTPQHQREGTPTPVSR